MPRKKVAFGGYDGSKLAALLELPEGKPVAYALFAHCFSCGKDIAAASRISRSLAGEGYAVLRFDFTGLGNSDGDFANANFSSNVDDLVLAAQHLTDNFMAPKLLIGHSLGGTAVLAAAARIKTIQAVVTIGAPSAAAHVTKQFSASVADIEETGIAQVELAGRPFTIKKQFLDDVNSDRTLQDLKALRKPLLVFHSPIDATVSINEAEKIYVAAVHPKSFVSLDDADHLLTRKQDSEYVAMTIANWASRYLTQSPAIDEPSVTGGEVLVQEQNHRFTRRVVTDSHNWLSDEPKKVGGSDLGPDPYEHLLAALGTCTSMTIRMYANRKKIPLDDVAITLRHSRDHFADCENCDENDDKDSDQNSGDTGTIETLHREVSLVGELTADQRRRLLEIADRCPVHKTLESNLRITTEGN